MSNIAIIEKQTEGGSWIKISECANKAPQIKMALNAALKAHPNDRKFRAIDSVSKQLLDMEINF
jgi:hypothetical protein